MKWQLVWTPHALKDIRKLDGVTRERIVSLLERFAETGIGDVLQLTDVHPPEWRLRVGDWRIRFRKDPTQATLMVLRILRRDKAY
jgi:mRNA-degrading endonuclease RelE of RelBE toxin-antitoxin system